MKELDIKITDDILTILKDYGFSVIDTQLKHGEQFDIFNIHTISEDYFNEKINEAIRNNNNKLDEVTKKL